MERSEILATMGQLKLYVSVRKGIESFESVTGGAFNLLNLFVSDESAGQEYLRWTYVEPEESRQA